MVITQNLLQPSTYPPLPRATLRVGIAGTRNLEGSDSVKLLETLADILEIIAKRLASQTPNPPNGSNEPGGSKEISAYSEFLNHSKCPQLRVVTGLCEGFDEVAAQAVDGLAGKDFGRGDRANVVDCVETTLAAVIPFEMEDYLRSRPDSYKSTLVKRASQCEYVCVVDGNYQHGQDEDAKHRRARGYRAQAGILLRQVDFLIAAPILEAEVRPGGTLETVEAALRSGISVILVNPTDCSLSFLRPGLQLSSALEKLPGQWMQNSERAAIEEEVIHLVDQVIGAPKTVKDSKREPLLAEYFEDKACPPVDKYGRRKKSIEEGIWEWFRGQFKLSGFPATESEDEQDPMLRQWRGRASDLNYHYSGLYRGSFISNAFLAVTAVSLAAVTLLILSPFGTEICIGGKCTHVWNALLLALASAKFLVVVKILRTIRSSRRGRWNDKAVDYRYLAERMRALMFSPRLGILRPSVVRFQQYASKLGELTPGDWLFDTFSRSFIPSGLVKDQSVGQTDETQAFCFKEWRCESLQGLKDVQEDWLCGQAAYHAKTACEMGAMEAALEKWGKWLSWLVVIIVLIDICIVVAEAFHAAHPYLVLAASWLILFAAVFPAIVASLNAVRFQSECGRLEDRSRVVSGFLGCDLAQWVKNPADPMPLTGEGPIAEVEQLIEQISNDKKSKNPLGGWASDVATQVEDISRDFTREVTEWSVLYQKELSE